MTREHLINGTAQAVICNSGNANTCAPNGVEIAEKTCEITGSALGLAAEDIIVCSTGVIGQELSIKPFDTTSRIFSALKRPSHIPPMPESASSVNEYLGI